MISLRALVLVGITTLSAAACGGSESNAPPVDEGAAPRSATGADLQVDSAGVTDPEAAPPPSAGSEELDSAGGRVPAGGASAPARTDRPVSVTPPPADAPDAVSILRRAERAYGALRSMEADFVQELSVPLLNSTQRSRGRIYHRQPDRFLMKFSDPAGDVVVADGRHLWLYYPSNDPKQVIRTSVGEAGQPLDLQREFLSNPTARYNATLEGTESLDGRPAYVLTLVPKQPSGYRRIRLWVDDGDALVRRFEIVEQNDALRRLDLRAIRPNVALGDALFRFTPPRDAQVFDQ